MIRKISTAPLKLAVLAVGLLVLGVLAPAPALAARTPAFTISDGTLVEGDSGSNVLVFTVRLANRSGKRTTVNFATADGTAKAGRDYRAARGQLTFTGSRTTRRVLVTVLGDTSPEPTTRFRVTLSRPTRGALLRDRTGVGTILDNDRVLLTTTRAGSGSGTVTSSPTGIDCGGDCSETYPYGTSVTLTATPASGSTFSGWSGGGCTGTGTCTVTLTQAADVTATFTLSAYTLIVARNGNGSGTVTSSPTGINCGLDCTNDYTYGTSVTLTATPASGSTFAGWSGGGCTGTGTCTVTLTEAADVTATFILSTYTLSVARNGNGSGTVTSSPTGINCGLDCTNDYTYGTSVTLTATPATGSTFTGWSGGGCTGAGTCTVTLTEAADVTATFILQSYTLTVSLNGGGTGVVTSSPTGINCGLDCTNDYTYGTSVTMTATPATGSTFAGWSGSCSGFGSCVVTMAAARTVIAVFDPVP